MSLSRKAFIFVYWKRGCRIRRITSTCRWTNATNFTASCSRLPLEIGRICVADSIQIRLRRVKGILIGKVLSFVGGIGITISSAGTIAWYNRSAGLTAFSIRRAFFFLRLKKEQNHKASSPERSFHGADRRIFLWCRHTK